MITVPKDEALLDRLLTDRPFQRQWAVDQRAGLAPVFEVYVVRAMVQGRAYGVVCISTGPKPAIYDAFAKIDAPLPAEGNAVRNAHAKGMGHRFDKSTDIKALNELVRLRGECATIIDGLLVVDGWQLYPELSLEAEARSI